MVRIVEGERDWDSVDACIEAFEQAQAHGGRADLADFLPHPDHQCYMDALVELLRVDLEYHWRRGEIIPLELYRDRFPEIFADPVRLADVAFEEYRLRRQAGQEPMPDEYRDRFGVEVDGWPVQPTGRDVDDEPPEASGRPPGGTNGCRLEPPRASALIEALHETDPKASRRLAHALASLPSPGSRFLGFQLEAELGSGAFGRVYLARQGDLAGRPVALKISADVAGESHALARLQHTNVMPVYSVHRDRRSSRPSACPTSARPPWPMSPGLSAAGPACPTRAPTSSPRSRSVDRPWPGARPGPTEAVPDPPRTAGPRRRGWIACEG